MKKRSWIFLIFWLCLCHIGFCSDPQIDPYNGAILRKNFVFEFQGKRFNLEEQAKRLCEYEVPFTPLLAMTTKVDYMKNISFGSVICCQNIIKDFDSPIIVNLFGEKGRAYLFESGYDSDLKSLGDNLFKKIRNKPGEGNFPEGLSHAAGAFGAVELNVQLRKEEWQIIDHFHDLWWRDDFLNSTEKKIRQHAKFAGYVRDYLKLSDDVFSCPHPQHSLIQAEEGVQSSSDDEELEEVLHEEEHEEEGGMFDLFEMSPQDDESSKMVYKPMPKKGFLCELLDDLNTKEENEKLSCLLEHFKQIQDHVKKAGSYKSIMNRWCSEQKLIRQLLENPRDFIPEDISNVAIIFIMVHTYQTPCTCCRFSLGLLARRLSNEYNKKVHVVVSYREEFDDRTDYLPKEFENKLLPHASNEDALNLIPTFPDPHYISLHKL